MGEKSETVPVEIEKIVKFLENYFYCVDIMRQYPRNEFIGFFYLQTKMDVLLL